MRQSGARRARLLVVTVLLVLIVIAAVLPVLAEGRGTKTKNPSSQRRRKKFRAGVGKDFSEFLLVMGVIMACVIAPVFVVFVSSIYKDPAVPGLAREIWKALKGKLLSYLGQETPTKQRNSSRAFLGGTDRSLSSSLRRKDCRRELSNWVGDNDDEYYRASDEGATRFASRTSGSSPISPERLPSVRPKRSPTDYRPLLLHEYASDARRPREDDWLARRGRQEPLSIRATAETTAPFSSNLLFQRESWHANPSEGVKRWGLLPSESAMDAPPVQTSMGQPQRADYTRNNGGFETNRNLRWGSESLVGGEHGRHTAITAHGGGMYEDPQSREKPTRTRRPRGGVDTFNRHGRGGAQGN